MDNLFNPDALFWRLMSRFVDFVGLGLFWVALCMPIVTIAPASAALYYTVVKVFRQKEEGAFGVFWKAFKSNLRKGWKVTLICLPFALVFAWGYSIMSFYRNTSSLGTVMFVAYWVALLVPAGLVCYLLPMMGRFEMDLKQLFTTALALALRHLPTTFVLVLLHMQLILFTLEQWWPVLFTPVLTTLLASLFLERIFPKYLSEEENQVLKGELPEEMHD